MRSTRSPIEGRQTSVKTSIVAMIPVAAVGVRRSEGTLRQSGKNAHCAELGSSRRRRASVSPEALASINLPWVARSRKRNREGERVHAEVSDAPSRGVDQRPYNLRHQDGADPDTRHRDPQREAAVVIERGRIRFDLGRRCLRRSEDARERGHEGARQGGRKRELVERRGENREP
jgi:hypothetical protein